MRKNPNFSRDADDKPLASPVNGMETRGSEKVLEKHSGPTGGSGAGSRLAGQKVDRAASSTLHGTDGMDSRGALGKAHAHLKSQVVESKGNSWDKDKSIHHRMGKR